jgi:ubiquilin
MTININIRPSTGKTFQLQVDADTTTVKQLKESISAQMEDVSPSDLKLVFSGRILKDEDLCTDCSK